MDRADLLLEQSKSMYYVSLARKTKTGRAAVLYKWDLNATACVALMKQHSKARHTNDPNADHTPELHDRNVLSCSSIVELPDFILREMFPKVIGVVGSPWHSGS